jgi:hypothetical protein
MIRLVCLATALLGASAAIAQTTTATQPAATSGGQPVSAVQTVQGKAPGDKVICERQEELGSRLSAHKICKTASQWAEERRAARDDIDRAQTQRACYNNGKC